VIRALFLAVMIRNGTEGPMSGGGANSAHEPGARQDTMSTPARPFMRTIVALRRITFLAGGAVALAFVLGFVLVPAQVRSRTRRSTANAEGIVALTGGAARISDAIRAPRRGPRPPAADHGREPGDPYGRAPRDLLRQYQQLFGCCIQVGIGEAERKTRAGGREKAQHGTMDPEFARVTIESETILHSLIGARIFPVSCR